MEITIKKNINWLFTETWIDYDDKAHLLLSS